MKTHLYIRPLTVDQTVYDGRKEKHQRTSVALAANGQRIEPTADPADNQQRIRLSSMDKESIPKA